MISHVCKFGLALLPATLLFSFNASAQDKDAPPVKSWAAPLYYDLGANQGAQSEKAGVKSAAATVSAISAAPMVFVAIAPCRIMDTRDGSGYTGQYGSPAIPGNTTRTVTITGQCGIPAGAKAFSLNVVAWPNGGGPWTQVRWLSMWPTGDPAVVSTLNDYAATAVANAAVVPAGIGGAIDIYVSDWTNVFLDTNGYYMPPSALALSAGTVGAPALTFSNDANSGVYSPSAGRVSVAASGAERLHVDSAGIAVTGNVDMTGDLLKGGAYLLRTNSSNMAVGLNTGFTGNYNTAVGPGALQSLTPDDSGNTAIGVNAGNKIGYGAASQVNSNTAVGGQALSNTTTGGFNTALGDLALSSNVTGGENVAVGAQAFTFTTGSANVGVGSRSGLFNTGDSNTFVGAASGYGTASLSTGAANVGVGQATLYQVTTGFRNTVLGFDAAYNLTSGSYNVAIGSYAGQRWTTGSSNIAISTIGVDGESNTTRIGSNQTRAFMAGIRWTTTDNNNAIPVVIDSLGQLGTVSSSRRIKRDIEDMGDTTSTVMQLHPVRFRYTAHGPDSPQQYGLVAEEVAEIAPDLVARKDNGEVETVYYDKINAMLLNEAQKQHRIIESQNELIRKLEARLAEVENRLK